MKAMGVSGTGAGFTPETVFSLTGTPQELWKKMYLNLVGYRHGFVISAVTQRYPKH